MDAELPVRCDHACGNGTRDDTLAIKRTRTWRRYISSRYLYRLRILIVITAKTLLVQGVMSAISAGMLIYAATVEMLAGDFVFGDVEGGHHHHHHAHDDDEDPRFGHEHEHPRVAHMHDRQSTDHKWNGHQHHASNGNGGSVGQTSKCLPPPFVRRESERQRTFGHGDDMERNAGPNIVGTRATASSPTGEAHEHGEGVKKASMGKRDLAVVSLLAGVGTMILVALGE